MSFTVNPEQKMKKVFLTSGPRGSGKSTYIKQILPQLQDVTVISRDKIAIERFGSTNLSPYEGGYTEVMRIMFQEIKNHLQENENLTMILDCWNGFREERWHIIKELREAGADKVFCWMFVLPLETCLEWFFKKNDSAGFSKRGITRDYHLYYSEAEDIEEEGFDGVNMIDPRQIPLLLTFD